MSIYLGIDAGTQSVKLLAHDAELGSIVHVSSAPLQLISRPDGTREQHADWWLEALRSCMAALPVTLKKRVAAIGVSGQQHGFVALDKSGQVLTPVKLWCDTTTAAECDEITARFGGTARCLDAVGNPILPGYTASKVLWLKKNHPQAYAQLAHILLPHDYLNYYLTGEIFTEYGDASGTGYLNILRREYDNDMLLALDPERDLLPLLPPLLAAQESVPLAESARAEFGLPQGVRVATGGGDNMMAAFGTGAVKAGVLSMSLGTSGTLFAHSDQPALDARGELAAFCSSAGGWLPLLCTMNCTAATEITRKYLGRSLQECEQMLAESQPGAGGICTLPFFSGERSPNLPDARATLLGLSYDNATPANIYRAAVESATFTLRRGLDAFTRAGQRFSAIRLTGGGANSPHWRQMVADVFDLAVEVLAQQEGAALGAALQAQWAERHYRGDAVSLPELISENLRLDEALYCSPRRDAVQEYRVHYKKFTDQLDRLHAIHSGE